LLPAVSEELFKRLGELVAKKEQYERRLDTSKTILEFHKTRAMKGEDLFQDQELELWKVETDLGRVQLELKDLHSEKAGVEQQLGLMEKRGGVSLWPKPALHPPVSLEVDLHNQIEVTACCVCYKWFTYFDVAFSSYKHAYHIFCLALHCQNNNHCKKCGNLFYPNWWTTFGFRELDEELKKEAKALNVSLDLDCFKKELLEECATYLPDGI
jgi:hypothetical protein